MKTAIVLLALAFLALVSTQPFARAVIVRDWSVQTGAWTFRGISLTGEGVSSRVVSSQTFPSDRIFQVKMKTLVAGDQSWYVAWMVGKYVDECNRVHFLIHTNGFLEFTTSAGCTPNFHFVQSTLNPLDWHTVRMELVGNNGKVFVDNVLYFDISDPIIGAQGSGSVQLVSWGPSSSTFFKPQVS